MTYLSYTTVDKRAWLRGGWDTEPDKAQWIDEATGLDCLIVRGSYGALCGYVGVPPEHPWHGVHYGACILGEACTQGAYDPWCVHRPDMIVQVHGGLTFSAVCQESSDPARGVCHLPRAGRSANVWWFGFDCAHANDDLLPAIAGRFGPEEHQTYKRWDYVEAEVASLALQLAKHA